MIDKGTIHTKQVGFVRFKTEQDAATALNRMNGYQIEADFPQLVGL